MDDQDASKTVTPSMANLADSLTNGNTPLESPAAEAIVAELTVGVRRALDVETVDEKSDVQALPTVAASVMRRTDRSNAREGLSGLETVQINSGQRSEMARVAEAATGVSAQSASQPPEPYASFDAVQRPEPIDPISPAGLRDGFGSGGQSSLGFCVKPAEFMNQTGRQGLYDACDVSAEPDTASPLPELKQPARQSAHSGSGDQDQARFIAPLSEEPFLVRGSRFQNDMTGNASYSNLNPSQRASPDLSIRQPDLVDSAADASPGRVTTMSPVAERKSIFRSYGNRAGFQNALHEHGGKQNSGQRDKSSSGSPKPAQLTTSQSQLKEIKELEVQGPSPKQAAKKSTLHKGVALSKANRHQRSILQDRSLFIDIYQHQRQYMSGTRLVGEPSLDELAMGSLKVFGTKIQASSKQTANSPTGIHHPTTQELALQLVYQLSKEDAEAVQNHISFDINTSGDPNSPEGKGPPASQESQNPLSAFVHLSTDFENMTQQNNAAKSRGNATVDLESNNKNFSAVSTPGHILQGAIAPPSPRGYMGLNLTKISERTNISNNAPGNASSIVTEKNNASNRTGRRVQLISQLNGQTVQVAVPPEHQAEAQQPQKSLVINDASIQQHSPEHTLELSKDVNMTLTQEERRRRVTRNSGGAPTISRNTNSFGDERTDTVRQPWQTAKDESHDMSSPNKTNGRNDSREKMVKHPLCTYNVAEVPSKETLALHSNPTAADSAFVAISGLQSHQQSSPHGYSNKHMLVLSNNARSGSKSSTTQDANLNVPIQFIAGHLLSNSSANQLSFADLQPAQNAMFGRQVPDSSELTRHLESSDDPHATLGNTARSLLEHVMGSKPNDTHSAETEMLQVAENERRANVSHKTLTKRIIVRNADEYGNTHTPVTFLLGPQHMETRTSDFMKMMGRHRRDIEVQELSRLKAELTLDGFVRKPRVILNKAQEAAGSLKAAHDRQMEKQELEEFILQGQMKKINSGESLDKHQKTIKDKSVSPRHRDDLTLSIMDNRHITLAHDVNDFQTQTQSALVSKKYSRTIEDRLAVGAADAATANIMPTPASLPAYGASSQLKHCVDTEKGFEHYSRQQKLGMNSRSMLSNVSKPSVLQELSLHQRKQNMMHPDEYTSTPQSQITMHDHRVDLFGLRHHLAVSKHQQTPGVQTPFESAAHSSVLTAPAHPLSPKGKNPPSPHIVHDERQQYLRAPVQTVFERTQSEEISKQSGLAASFTTAQPSMQTGGASGALGNSDNKSGGAGPGSATQLNTQIQRVRIVGSGMPLQATHQNLAVYPGILSGGQQMGVMSQGQVMRVTRVFASNRPSAEQSQSLINMTQEAADEGEGLHSYAERTSSSSVLKVSPVMMTLNMDPSVKQAVVMQQVESTAPAASHSSFKQRRRTIQPMPTTNELRDLIPYNRESMASLLEYRVQGGGKSRLEAEPKDNVEKVEALSSINSKTNTNPVHGKQRFIFMESARFGRCIQGPNGNVSFNLDENFEKLNPEKVSKLERAYPFATITDNSTVERVRRLKCLYKQYDTEILTKRKAIKYSQDMIPKQARLQPVQAQAPKGAFKRRNLSVSGQTAAALIMSPKAQLPYGALDQTTYMQGKLSPNQHGQVIPVYVQDSQPSIDDFKTRRASQLTMDQQQQKMMNDDSTHSKMDKGCDQVDLNYLMMDSNSASGLPSIPYDQNAHVKVAARNGDESYTEYQSITDVRRDTSVSIPHNANSVSKEQSYRVLNNGEKNVVFADEKVVHDSDNVQGVISGFQTSHPLPATSPNETELDSELVQPNLLQHLKRSGKIHNAMSGSESALQSISQGNRFFSLKGSGALLPLAGSNDLSREHMTAQTSFKSVVDHNRDSKILINVRSTVQSMSNKEPSNSPPQHISSEHLNTLFNPIDLRPQVLATAEVALASEKNRMNSRYLDNFERVAKRRRDSFKGVLFDQKNFEKYKVFREGASQIFMRNGNQTTDQLGRTMKSDMASSVRVNSMFQREMQDRSDFLENFDQLRRDLDNSGLYQRVAHQNMKFI